MEIGDRKKSLIPELQQPVTKNRLRMRYNYRVYTIGNDGVLKNLTIHFYGNIQAITQEFLKKLSRDCQHLRCKKNLLNRLF